MQEIRSNIKYTKNKLIFGYFLKQSWAGGWSDSFALLLILLFTTTTSSSSSQCCNKTTTTTAFAAWSNNEGF